jgi:hypothetical protein
MWPHLEFPPPSLEMISSVRTARRTLVVAGNMLGKDWTLGRLCLAFWYSPWTFFPRGYFSQVEHRTEMQRLAEVRGLGSVREIPEHILHQRRIVTTSVKGEHLAVLWGEIGNAWRTCAVDLSARFAMNDQEVRFKEELEGVRGKNVNSYLVGMVSGSDNFEGLTGHHAPYTFAVGDEASGLPNGVFDAFATWAKRECYIGNPRPCNNKYRTEFQQGDLLIGAAGRGAA